MGNPPEKKGTGYFFGDPGGVGHRKSSLSPFFRPHWGRVVLATLASAVAAAAAALWARLTGDGLPRRVARTLAQAHRLEHAELARRAHPAHRRAAARPARRAGVPRRKPIAGRLRRRAAPLLERHETLAVHSRSLHSHAR